MLDEELLQRDSVFRVGRVVSVEGRRVRVTVDKMKNGSHLIYKGGIVRNVSAGSYLKIAKGFAEMIAKVDGEQVDEDRGVSPDYHRPTDRMKRVLEVSLVGFIEKGKFERGVRELPLLDNECFILTEDEFNQVHWFVDPNDVSITIGALAAEPTKEVQVGANAIFGSHVGIFGNTGSGKSYTLAKLYHEIFKQFSEADGFADRARFVIIDFNGEYVDRPAGEASSTAVIVDPSLKRTYSLSTGRKVGDRLPLSLSAIQNPTFWTVLLDATEKTQAPFLTRVLTSDYWERRLPDSAALLDILGDLVVRATRSTDISIDHQTINSLLLEIQTCLGTDAPTELQQAMDTFQRELNYNSTQNKHYWGAWSGRPFTIEDPAWDGHIKGHITGLPIDFTKIGDIDLIRFKIVLQYYADIIGGHANREHLSPLIKRLKNRVDDIKKLVRVDAAGLATKPLTVVSLRDVNLAMRKVIPMLVCKQLYDEKKDTDVNNERYLNLIIDEAHNILSNVSNRESEAWKDYRLETFEEIIKEGRKFGVFLTIASQRPHDISETIISQLHNYFLHRLINNLDIHAVERAVSYLDRVSFDSIPILATGSCVIAGIAAQVPVVVKIGQLAEENEPNSRTMSVTKTWSTAMPVAETEEEPLDFPRAD